MTRLLVAAAMLALSGCEVLLGIDDPTFEPPGDTLRDAAPGEDVDAGGDIACNPVTQTGCVPGEKCAAILVSAGVFQTGCAPQGSINVGEACEPPQVGTADSCVGGSTCFFGICRENCLVANGCDPTFSCNGVNGLFGDVAGPAGLCSPLCDPLVQDCVDANHACYLNPETNQSLCAGIGDPNATQGVACANGQCFLNSCAVGFGSLVSSTAGGQADSCGFYCAPVDTHTGDTTQPAGASTDTNCASTFGGARSDGPGAGFQCRFIQTFVSNGGNTDDTAGICVDPAVHGDCTSCDITDSGTFAMTCPPGCVSAATESAIP